MKFSCSFLVLLVVLFVPALSAPVESGLSKRSLNWIGNVGFPSGRVVLTDTESSMNGHLEHSSKRDTVSLNLILGLINVSLLKRSIENDLLIDNYSGRHTALTLSDAMVKALEQNGVQEEQFSQYICNNVYAMDPETGREYGLTPDNSSVGPSIYILMDYLPDN